MLSDLTPKKQTRTDKTSDRTMMNGEKLATSSTFSMSGHCAPSKHSYCSGKESHRGETLCDRDALWAQVVTMGRTSSSSSRWFVNVVEQRHVGEMLLLVERLWKRPKMLSEDQDADGSSPGSEEPWNSHHPRHPSQHSWKGR